MNVLKISMYPHSDGATFSISPMTKRKIQTRFSDSFSASPVVLTFEPKTDAAKLPKMYGQVISLLTGLEDPNQLAELFEAIEIVDFDSSETIFSTNASNYVSFSRASR